MFYDYYSSTCRYQAERCTTGHSVAYKSQRKTMKQRSRNIGGRTRQWGENRGEKKGIERESVRKRRREKRARERGNNTKEKWRGSEERGDTRQRRGRIKKKTGGERLTPLHKVEKSHRCPPLQLLRSATSTALSESHQRLRPYQRLKGEEPNRSRRGRKQKQRLAPLHGEEEEKQQRHQASQPPPQLAAATPTPPWATSTVNDGASILGNSLPFVLVSHFIFLHAERALCTFLHARRNNYPVTVHEHSNG
jgi:hypothetical protein